MNEQEFIVRDFMRALRVTRPTAETLVERGYSSVEEVAYVPQTELLTESGLPTAEALAIRAVAREFLLQGTSGRP